MTLPHASQFVESNTARLAATYLVLIMLMSIAFSLVFYNISSQALYSQRPPQDLAPNQIITILPENSSERPQRTSIRDFLNSRADEGRSELIARLILINLLTLLVGAGISYYLARRTLQPIEANMEAQRQFVSDASHELRTPLTAIQTSNEVALRNRKLSLAEAKTVISDNTAEAAKLKLLSDALLNLALNDQVQQPLDTIALHSSVQTALNQVIALAQPKNIAVEDTVAAVNVRGNAHILSQILVILIDNAIKYSHDGATIYISSFTKGNSVYVEVRDEGVGIRASDIPHLFRRFYRADSARSDGHREGYGLGLAIADNLARSHSASISVASELHKGSRFTLKLERAK